MKIIKADRIITGDGKTVLENGAVALEGSRIAAVGELSGLTARWPDAPVETMDGCTLLPGLIDMHVHISGLYRRPEKQEMQENPAYLMLMVYKHLQDALGVGITTLRGVGEAKGIGAAVRGGYRKGFIKGPRYITWEGADWIKVMDSHRGHFSEFTLEELCAVTDEAHRLGRKCAIHAGNEQSVSWAVEAGFDSIEHGAYLEEDLCRKAIEKGLAWVPTIYVYENSVDYMKRVTPNPTKADLVGIKFLEDTVEGYRRNFLRNYKMGILVATGTDICFPEMFITPLQEEIKTFVRYGLTNLEAIQCATSNGAKILEMDDEIGFVAEGYCADLLLVEGDPSQDINALDNVRQVYRAGELLVNKA